MKRLILTGVFFLACATCSAQALTYTVVDHYSGLNNPIVGEVTDRVFRIQQNTSFSGHDIKYEISLHFDVPSPKASLADFASPRVTDTNGQALPFINGVYEIWLPKDENRVLFEVRLRGDADTLPENFRLRVEEVSGVTLQPHANAYPIIAMPGDANGDGEWTSDDLILVLQAGKYETGQFATWAEGDWTGDGKFDSSDLLLAYAVNGSPS